MDTKIEGTVQLSVSELDNLRNKINQLTLEKEELLKHSKEVKINLVVEENKYTTQFNWDHRIGYLEPTTKVVKDKTLIEESIKYVGLDEVISNLTKEAEEKVIEKIGNLDREIINLKTKEQNLITSYKQTLIDKSKEHQDTIKKLQNAFKEEKEKLILQHEESIKNLQAEINVLKGVVEDKTKDDTIRRLQAELESIKLKKSFWGFLH